MKRAIALMICTALALASASCNKDQIRQVREAGNRLVIYSEAGIKIIEELKTSGALNGVEGPTATALKSLATIRDTTQVFVDRTAKYDKFDVNSRTDLLNAFTDVMSALKEMQPQITVLAGNVVKMLKERGVNIKDPDAVVRRLLLAIDVLNTSALLIRTRLEP